MENPSTRTSVIVFSDKPDRLYTLPTSQELDNSALRYIIVSAEYQAGEAVNSHLALQQAFVHLLEHKNMEEEVPQALLYLTASESNDPLSTQIWAQHLTDAAVQTFSMGIGSNINVTELEIIAANKVGHVFKANDFDEIQDHLFEVSTKICDAL